MKVNVNESRCKECGLCIAHCPKEAIYLRSEVNSKGYRTVVVREDKCIGCGMCYLTCPDGVYQILA
ncbi:4Fe-4S dicluster domain-containing protein [Bacilliculturomica massiliensis]|uniref:4Fe-4S dicluster domain-containing protein n=1 Tax=Bacilliculturomica massiliensis TaxID=1917867 RepID=UPI00103179E9|nr:4Fe-4S dicluster-binding protein [Bacilliculturomica massiliensis]